MKENKWSFYIYFYYNRERKNNLQWRYCCILSIRLNEAILFTQLSHTQTHRHFSLEKNLLSIFLVFIRIDLTLWNGGKWGQKAELSVTNHRLRQHTGQRRSLNKPTDWLDLTCLSPHVLQVTSVERWTGERGEERQSWVLPAWGQSVGEICRSAGIPEWRSVCEVKEVSLLYSL